MTIRSLRRSGERGTEKQCSGREVSAPGVSDNPAQAVSSHGHSLHGESNRRSRVIDSKRYWWCQSGQPETLQPIFEPVDEALIISGIKERIRLNELPLIEIPENIIRTLKLLDDPDFDYSEVTSLIEHSPAMAGQFIKIINSSLYSPVVAISDLKSALHRLGQAKVKALLYIYSASMNFLGGKAFNDAAIKVVEHSYATGIVASYLSQRFYPDPDLAFLSGLMHDIGKLSIIRLITDTHELPPKFPFEITEDAFVKIFPELHEPAGKFIADHWGLDRRVCTVIRHHHDLKPRAFSDDSDSELTVNLCHLIAVSDTITRMLNKGRPLHTALNLFELPSAQAIGLEKNWSNVDFLKDIPAMLSFKLEQ